MTLTSSWQFIGSTNATPYRFFDWLRGRLNERLVRRLAQYSFGQCEHDSVRVLESGCGPGLATSLFARRTEVRSAVCVDIDLAALREGRKRDAGLLAVVADMRTLPFAAGSFSLVFNSSTLEHLDEPGIALDEMARVCAAEGKVFVGVPYLYGPLGFEPLVRRTALGKWLGPVFDRGKLERLFVNSGLEPLLSFNYFWRFFIGVIGMCPNSPANPAVHSFAPRGD